jgi:hypothetical protein
MEPNMAYKTCAVRRSNNKLRGFNANTKSSPSTKQFSGKLRLFQLKIVRWIQDAYVDAIAYVHPLHLIHQLPYA